MYSTSFKLLFFLVLTALTLVTGCSKSRQPVTAAPPSAQSPAATRKTTNDAVYGGITFTFDRSLTNEVKGETIAAVTEGKPSDVVPEHLAFTLVGYPRPRSMTETDPEIRVFSVAKFRDALHRASREMAKNTKPPTEDWGPDVDEEVRVLRTLLAKQPKSDELREFLATARASEKNKSDDFPQMPFLPMWEASQAFFTRPQYVNFKNGHGVFFLTQWNVSETSQVTNDGLEYAFQGITDNGQFYVYAEFSVTAPFLPRDKDPEVSAWNDKNYLLAQKSKGYQDYLKPIVAKLQALPADQYKPNLNLLEQMIESMEVHPQ